MYNKSSVQFDYNFSTGPYRSKKAVQDCLTDNLTYFYLQAYSIELYNTKVNVFIHVK